MAIQTRNSALAVKVEATEGTPVVPSASGDYVALQDDFSMEPALANLENAELKASLGPSKPISGIEEPTASFSHYLRHSGVEGQAPNYGDILKASFGNEEVQATEYDTVAGSTTSAVKVDAGEGVNYRRGQAVLVKDATNGYSIRPIDSVSTDDLNLGFNLDNAPGTGVNLGKAVTYYPANDDTHPTLSIWHYIGNQGAIQALSGARVTDASYSMAAGELINASYSFEGVSYYLDPITITATNKYVDFNDGAVQVASVAEKTYKYPKELASALETAMDGQSTDTITVTYSNSTGKFTIASDGATLSLLWSTGASGNTMGATIGFDTASDDTGALTYTGDNALDYSSPQSPSFDSADPLVAKDNECLIGDSDDTSCFAANSVDFTVSTPKANIDSICAESGRAGSVISSREVKITVSALLNKYDAEWFYRLKENTETRFCYIGGSKSGGSWLPGKSFCFYIPSAVVSSVDIVDSDGLAQINLELTAYVNADGEDEVALSFV